MVKPSNIIRAEMAKQGIKTKDICLMFKERGTKLDVQSFNMKISRGTFNAVFFLECLDILGVETLRLKS